MYRFLKPYLVPPPPSASFQIYAEQCDMWLRCAVGCTCMEIGDHKVNQTFVAYSDNYSIFFVVSGTFGSKSLILMSPKSTTDGLEE